MLKFSRLFGVSGVVLGLLLCARPAWADNDILEQQELQRLQAEGKIIPAETIIRQVEKQFGGKVVEIELDREFFGWEYEIDLVNAEGWKKEIKVDAQTGKPIGQ